MKAITLHDRDEIAFLLCHNPLLHLYELGDLDDFFWKYTTWYGFESEAGVRHVVLLYMGTSLPVLLALAEEPLTDMKELLRLLVSLLPRRLYAHLSGDLAGVLSSEYRVESHGEHYKMALKGGLLSEGVDTSETIRLTASDLHDLETLYRTSYPGNRFDPRMLETGRYYGIRSGGRLVSAAGVHAFSPEYRVAALGNITTHPDLRGVGLAAKVTARLCQELQREVKYIGLNVKAENRSAIACYEKLGFERIASYEECSLELKERLT